MLIVLPFLEKFSMNLRTHSYKSLSKILPQCNTKVIFQSRNRLSYLFKFKASISLCLYSHWFTNGTKYPIKTALKNLNWHRLLRQTISLQIFQRLSSTNFTWSILEYFAPNICVVIEILFAMAKLNVTLKLELVSIWACPHYQEKESITTKDHCICQVTYVSLMISQSWIMSHAGLNVW